MKRSAKKKILPSYVFKKISGVKHRITCYGCHKKFTTLHSAKKYCDDCLHRTQKAEEATARAMKREAAAKKRAAAKRKEKRETAKKSSESAAKKTVKKRTLKKTTKKKAKRPAKRAAPKAKR